jgi:GLPGLI family protein
MQKLSFFYFLFISFGIVLTGQAQEKVGKGEIRAIYKNSVAPDSTKPHQLSYDTMFLEFSKERSVYYNPQRRISDSLTYASLLRSIKTGANLDMKDFGNYRRTSTVIVHNYPEEQKITFYSANIGNKPFVYEERQPLMQWQIHEESKQINGYNCQKASTQFRGRSYEAWFSSEVPTPFGPYKFYGLPGIIVSLKDSRGHFHFELIGVQRLPADYTMITHYDSGEPRFKIVFERISLKRYNQEMKKYTEDPVAYLVAKRMNSPVSVEAKNPQNQKKSQSIIYNPIELNED